MVLPALESYSWINVRSVRGGRSCSTNWWTNTCGSFLHISATFPGSQAAIISLFPHVSWKLTSIKFYSLIKLLLHLFPVALGPLPVSLAMSWHGVLAMLCVSTSLCWQAQALWAHAPAFPWQGLALLSHLFIQLQNFKEPVFDAARMSSAMPKQLHEETPSLGKPL